MIVQLANGRPAHQVIQIASHRQQTVPKRFRFQATTVHAAEELVIRVGTQRF